MDLWVFVKTVVLIFAWLMDVAGFIALSVELNSFVRKRSLNEWWMITGVCLLFSIIVAVMAFTASWYIWG
jgi:hypothetical protein